MTIKKVEYRLGEIPANTLNVSFELKLEKQPCLIREVHTQGEPSTNYSIRIYDRSRKWLLDKVYEKAGINKESHEIITGRIFYEEPEKKKIWIVADNADTTNKCSLLITLVIEEL